MTVFYNNYEFISLPHVDTILKLSNQSDISYKCLDFQFSIGVLIVSFIFLESIEILR